MYLLLSCQPSETRRSHENESSNEVNVREGIYTLHSNQKIFFLKEKPSSQGQMSVMTDTSLALKHRQCKPPNLLNDRHTCTLIYSKSPVPFCFILATSEITNERNPFLPERRTEEHHKVSSRSAEPVPPCLRV